MSYRYRGIFAALAGLTLLAAGGPPAKQDGGNPSNASNEKIERTLEAISATLKQANEPSQHDKPCPDGKDDRSSDLCAQWKAADAADSAARAAWMLGIIGTVVGALTLAAAWSAAKWAKKAAEHTESGAIEAQRAADAAEKSLRQADRTSRAELRAYVVINQASYSFDSLRAAPTVRLSLVNVGQTPAFDVCGTGVVRFASEPPAHLRFDMRKEPRGILGRDLPMPMEILSDHDSGVERAGKDTLFVIGEIRYTDIFRQRWVQRFTLEQSAGYGTGRLRTAIRGNSEKRWRE